ncbi:unnamed protein product [Parnassius mnemosyne]|uniref:Secreted protein n=1 Tax=Parnassius mnemosyne TaxID=213953 RepID=A0AAV1LWZ9_9NEOP
MRLLRCSQVLTQLIFMTVYSKPRHWLSITEESNRNLRLLYWNPDGTQHRIRELRTVAQQQDIQQSYLRRHSWWAELE